jgi:acyl-coenzyme A synthetase/AMP-(fatty) acid ligase/acyl carrier protein
VGLAQEVILSPRALASKIAQERMTALFLTTALFNQIAREAPQAFRPLRHLLFGGELVDVRWVREVLTRGCPGRLLHVYGPTETTTFAAWFLVEEVSAEADTVPIGRPLSNTELYVLDATRQPVPVGVPGELYIGGPGLARGYHCRPELTAEKFVPHPFSDEVNARLYCTGDRVRWRRSGCLEFLGRIDNQVKIRGFRVEPGEIEACLRAQGSVCEAAVIVREDEPGDRRLVAYAVPHKGQEAAMQGLRQALKATLPSYMIPSAIVPLAALPLNANGKLDREALPAPNQSRGELPSEHAPPRSATQRDVAGIWSEVLNIDQLGLDDNFFELGGHSLLATQVISRLRAAFRVEIPLASLFSAPTVAALAEVIEAALVRPSTNTAAALEEHAESGEI